MLNNEDDDRVAGRSLKLINTRFLKLTRLLGIGPTKKFDEK